ncbi:hypothetical protein AB0M43_13075 [Longispora sp. NPDC051575]|uniref:hypothetical protein n=1 Tax=Longispora sp. NPDC051575 TaxID=3154943 RepID=UPI00343760E3
MSLSRFVFLAMPGDRGEAPTPDGVAWMLISPNNRPLGRSWRLYDTYAACSAAVSELRVGYDRIRSHAAVADTHGHWAWRIDLDGSPVAGSTRSYLRIRECGYNLECFLTATPVARVVEGARSVRGGRWRADDEARKLTR